MTTFGHGYDIDVTMDMTFSEPPVLADLPIADRAQAIARAVSEHPVTLVVGATGFDLPHSSLPRGSRSPGLP